MYLKKPLKLRKKESINPWNINTGKEIPLVHPFKYFSRPTALNFEERTRLQSQETEAKKKKKKLLLYSMIHQCWN